MQNTTTPPIDYNDNRNSTLKRVLPATNVTSNEGLWLLILNVTVNNISDIMVIG